MMSIDDQLVELASTLTWCDVPAAVRNRMGDLAFDCLGCCIGATRLPVMSALNRIIEPVSTPGRSVRLPWRGPPLGPEDAAMLVSTAAHGLDFDDTHLATSLHPTSPVIGPTMVVAQLTGCSIGDWLAGMLVGVETACRLGEVAHPREQYARGFHPTATCGAIAAAAGSARLLRLSRDLANAIGIALGGASGTMQFLANDADSKPLQVGWVARAGLSAARLASEGLRGASSPVSGRNGFARMFGNGEVGIVAPAFDRWMALEVGVKPYPSCRRGHALIEAAFEIRESCPAARESHAVERIEFGATERSLDMIGPSARR